MPIGEGLDALAARVRSLMDEQSIKDNELAQHLGLTPAGLSKAFHRRDGLRSRITEIAEYLDVLPAALTSVGGGQGGSGTSKAATAQRPRSDAVALPPGCSLVRIAKESIRAFGKGRFAILGPPIMRPVIGTVVAYLGPDGYRVRTYTTDATKEHIVLTHPAMETMPEVHPLKKAPAMRVVIALGERMKGDL